MFKWSFRARDGTKTDLLEAISIEIEKLKISKLAIEKAVGMIAKAIAKSEFVVLRKDGRVKDHVYYLLNIQPNANETATDFWLKAIHKLLIEEECLICMVNDNLYVADTFTKNNSVILPQIYSNVRITANGESMELDRTFLSRDVIHLKSGNKKIKQYLEKVAGTYDETISVMMAGKKLASAPKFELQMEGPQPVVRRLKEDGTEEELTIDDYKKSIKKLLESDDIEILTNSSGLMTKQMKIETPVSSEDIVKLEKEIFEETALAFDIPKAVFLGEITEKADSTNEFITYGVSWIVEILNDSLNASLVGETAYLNGERIWIDLSKYKHVDTLESAANLDKLRSIGFSFDEIREMVGLEPLNTDFSQERVITKNYTNDLGGEGGKQSE